MTDEEETKTRKKIINSRYNLYRWRHNPDSPCKTFYFIFLLKKKFFRMRSVPLDTLI